MAFLKRKTQNTLVKRTNPHSMVTNNVQRNKRPRFQCPHCNLIIFNTIFPSHIARHLQNDHHWQEELSPGHSLIWVICAWVMYCVAPSSKGLFSSGIVYRLRPFFSLGYGLLLSSHERVYYFYKPKFFSPCMSKHAALARLTRTTVGEKFQNFGRGLMASW